MRSVTDDLRSSDRRRVEKLSPARRVALALALGERDLLAFQKASGLDRKDARRELERRRARGRRRSGCIEKLLR